MRALVILFVLGLLHGCGKTVYVPVESVRYETEYRTALRRDSIYIHDSVSVRERGDTLFVDRWHTHWRDRIVTDTLLESHSDTIYKAYPVAQKLSRWESFKLDYSAYIILSLAGICYFLIKRK